MSDTEDQNHDGITVNLDGLIATLTIARPQARNALGLKAWQALYAQIVALDANDAIAAIVVRGAGGHFSGGNDIVEFGALQGDPLAAEAFGAAMATAMLTLEECSKPVVIAIEGACYGAAVALALAGDLRLASDSARFAITPARLGALYLNSDLHRLTCAVGTAQSKRLNYTAEPIDGPEALRIGLIDQLWPQADFEQKPARFMSNLVTGSPFTLRRTKAMMRDVGPGPTPRETFETLAAFVEATQGPDFREGVAAFCAKRPPRFVQSLIG